MSKELGRFILVVLSVFLAGSEPGLAQDASKTSEDIDQFKQKFLESIESQGQAIKSARFVCPRYLLRWSMHLYSDAGVKTGEPVQLAQAAKTIADLANKELRSLPTELDANPTVKESMRAYTAALAQAAEAHARYFQTGDQKILAEIDSHLNQASTYEKQLEELLKGPVEIPAEAMLSNARVMCPRWLITWSESYYDGAQLAFREQRGYEKPGFTCDECVKVTEAAKTISEVFDKEAGQIADEKLRSLAAAYAKAMVATADAFAAYYQSGDEKAAERAHETQDQVLKVSQEIENYRPPKNQ